MKDLTDYKVTGNLTATAIWEDIAGTVEYTITYKDGNTEIGTDKVVSGSSLSLKTLEELKYSAPSGKTFAKWKVTDKTGAEVKAEDLTDYKVTGNLTATAVWGYEITYNANGGEESGEMSVGKATAGEAFTLPECKFAAPAGKEFSHWAVKNENDEYEKLEATHTFEADTTVYAIWKDSVAEN